MDLPDANVPDQIDHRKIIGNLKILTSFRPDDETSILSIEDVLKDILKKVQDLKTSPEILDQENDQGTVIDRYIRSLVNQLSMLVLFATSRETDPSRPLFSVSDCNDIKRAIEFLIGFGIYPILESGVVEPFWKISDSKNDIKRRFTEELFALATSTSTASGSDQNRYRFEKLGCCVECLFELWNCSSFRTLVASNFLGYFLGALLQLIATSQKSEAVPISKYSSYLERVIDGTYRPTVLRQLMAFQGKKTSREGKKVAAPTWLSSACSRLLSSFLMESHGILTFLCTLDDIDGSSPLNENWQRCESLATLVSARPRHVERDPSAYYENVCDQLIADQDLADRYSRFYVLLVQKLYAKSKPLVQRRILDPTLEVFGACCASNRALVPSEDIITRSIDKLKLLYASFPVDGSFFESLPADTILILMRMLFDIRNTVSHCRTTVKDVIRAFMEKASHEVVISVVKNWLLLRLPSNYLQLRFTPGSAGGVTVIREENQDLLDLQERIDVLHLAINDSSKEFRRQLFDDCLKLALDQESHNPAPATSALPVAEPLDPSEALAVFSFVVSFMEKDPSLGNANSAQTARLLTTLLENNSGGRSGGQDDELETLKTQNLLLVLGLVGALFSTGTVLDIEQEDMKELKKTLQRISDNHPDASICSAAKDLACILFASSSVDTEMTKEPSSNALCSDGPQSSYEQAMSDLHHPLLPVRAHALVVLTNLIKSKDVVACSKIDLLIQAILDRIDEDDTFVYLAAVNCLAAAGLFRPGVVLPVLMTLFKSGDGDKAPNADKRLKVGEAMVKISRELGDLAPFYGNDLINGFLSLLREGDDEIKASCLANVAEICRLMTFKLNMHIHELFYCAKQMLQWEKNELVRRSAINLLALLAENGDSFLEVLGDLSRDYYRFVKGVYEGDEDDVVRLHAQKCLENLGGHVKELLKPLIVPLD